MGRLGSGVWVSASFQIFALQRGNVLGGGKLSGRCKCLEGIRPRVKCQRPTLTTLGWTVPSAQPGRTFRSRHNRPLACRIIYDKLCTQRCLAWSPTFVRSIRRSLPFGSCFLRPFCPTDCRSVTDRILSQQLVCPSSFNPVLIALVKLIHGQRNAAVNILKPCMLPNH